MSAAAIKGGKYAIAFAVIIVGINIFITIRFVSRVHQIIELQSSSAIHLPITQPAKQPDDAVPILDLTMHADGTAYADGIPITNDSLPALLHARSPTKVVVHAEPNANYNQLKTLLLALRNAGASNIVLKVDDAK